MSANESPDSVEYFKTLVNTEKPAWPVQQSARSASGASEPGTDVRFCLVQDPVAVQCLDDLWQAESRWNHRARNKRTGACGIPQAYPCNKMSDAGKAYGVDYRSNPWPQIAWGLSYIDKRYGTPCKAWRKFQRGGGY